MCMFYGMKIFDFTTNYSLADTEFVRINKDNLIVLIQELRATYAVTINTSWEFRKNLAKINQGYLGDLLGKI